MQRESGGSPTAVGYGKCTGRNCYGKWQDDPLTWNHYKGYNQASDAPEDVQDEFNTRLWNNGTGCGQWHACQR